MLKIKQASLAESKFSGRRSSHSRYPSELPLVEFAHYELPKEHFFCQSCNTAGCVSTSVIWVERYQPAAHGAVYEHICLFIQVRLAFSWNWGLQAESGDTEQLLRQLRPSCKQCRTLACNNWDKSFATGCYLSGHYFGELPWGSKSLSKWSLLRPNVQGANCFERAIGPEGIWLTCMDSILVVLKQLPYLNSPERVAGSSLQQGVACITDSSAVGQLTCSCSWVVEYASKDHKTLDHGLTEGTEQSWRLL